MNAFLNRFCGLFGASALDCHDVLRAMGERLDPPAAAGKTAALGRGFFFARRDCALAGRPALLFAVDGDFEFREWLAAAGTGCLADLLADAGDGRDAGSLRRIPGGWALAAVNAGGTLLLARDRAGRRELYYTRLSGGGVGFASGIRALTAIPGIRPAMNTVKLPEYMAFRLIAGPDTLVRGVRRVLPGEAVFFSAGSDIRRAVRFRPYRWTRGTRTATTSGDARRLFDLLCDSVALSIDRNPGVFLMQSGGMDSNALLAAAREVRAGRLPPVTVVPDEEPYSEAAAAGSMALLQGCAGHQSVNVSAHDLFARIFEAHRLMEEPVAHVVSILHTKAYEAKHGAPGFLTGEAADTILGNNRVGKYSRCVGYAARVPAWLIARTAFLGGLPGFRTFSGVAGPDWRRFVCRSRMLLDGIRLGSLLRDYDEGFGERYALLEDFDDASRIEAACRYYFETSVHCCKAFGTLAGHWEMEPFFPFLAEPVQDFVFGLLPGRRFHGGHGKYILRKAMNRRLPRSVVWGRKRAGEQPLGVWFREHAGLKTLLTGLLHEDTGVLAYFQPDELRRTLTRHFSGEADESVALWQILSLEIWHRLVMESESDGEARAVMLARGRKVDLRDT